MRVDTAGLPREEQQLLLVLVGASDGQHRSYGTLAGQQYAELFAPNVDRTLLDSDMDHSLPNAWQFMRSHALAMEESFGQFVAWCGRNTACALHGQDVKKVHADLLARADAGMLTVPGSNPPRKVTGAVRRDAGEPARRQAGSRAPAVGHRLRRYGGGAGGRDHVPGLGPAGAQRGRVERLRPRAGQRRVERQGRPAQLAVRRLVPARPAIRSTSCAGRTSARC